MPEVTNIPPARRGMFAKTRNAYKQPGQPQPQMIKSAVSGPVMQPPVDTGPPKGTDPADAAPRITPAITPAPAPAIPPTMPPQPAPRPSRFSPEQLARFNNRFNMPMTEQAPRSDFVAPIIERPLTDDVRWLQQGTRTQSAPQPGLTGPTQSPFATTAGSGAYPEPAPIPIAGQSTAKARRPGFGRRI